MLFTYTSEETIAMIMMTEKLATTITMSNLPLCRHYEITKDSQKHGQRPCKNCEKVHF